MPILVLLLTLLPGQASLTGSWAMDRVKSDFGRAEAPRQFVLQIEQPATISQLLSSVLTPPASG